MATQTKQLTLAEAIELVQGECEAQGLPPGEVVNGVLLARLDEGALAECAHVGLVRIVTNKDHRERTGGNSTKVAHASTGRNPRKFVALRDIVLVGADGCRKPLMRFTREDVEHLRGQARAQRLAWTHREDWTKAVAEAMEEHDAEHVGDLPKDVLDDLGKQADKAWRSR